MPEPRISPTGATDLESAFAWLIDHSVGIVGLKVDGTVMPWDEVLRLYVPWMSAEWASKELMRETGVEGVTYIEEDDEDA